MELLTTENLIALLTLTLLEIVLGIDNIVFISILTAKVDEKDRSKARRIGLAMAMLMRIALLFSINWVMSLEDELFAILGHGFSGQSLILLSGGLFLIAKATHEIHDKISETEELHAVGGVTSSLVRVIVQITLLDIVFSLDSVITAVGMADELMIMIAAVVIAVIVMMIFANRIGDFVEKNPTIKMLALSFLIMIGVMLTVEGYGGHFEKGYVYFAMAFSLGVEMLNIRARGKEILKKPGGGAPAKSGAAS